jgi:hypothetical protein
MAILKALKNTEERLMKKEHVYSRNHDWYVYLSIHISKCIYS